MAEPVSLIPVWPPLWYTCAWLLFVACVVALFLSRRASTPLWSTPNQGIRRLTLLALGLVILVEAASRFSTNHMPGPVSGLGNASILVLAGVCVVTAIGLVWPPRYEVIFGLCLAGGLGLRLFGLATISSNAEFADNLPAIAAALDRLGQGFSPYGFYTYAHHSSSMSYLPLTVLAYFPAHLIGVDIRVTNIVLSLAQLVTLVVIIHVLRVPEPARCGLVLLCGINYFLPLNLGHDLYGEFQPFDLAIVLALGLTVIRHFRAAAVAVGLALGAMPVAVFCGPALLSYGGRRLGRDRLIRLTLVAASIAAVPLAAFVIWDPTAYINVATHEATLQFGNIRGALDSWPYSPIWYGLGPGLQVVQITLFAALTLLAIVRVRTVVGAAQLAALTYLLMLQTGPQSGSHVLGVVVPLVIIAEAARYGRREYFEKSAATT